MAKRARVSEVEAETIYHELLEQALLLKLGRESIEEIHQIIKSQFDRAYTVIKK